MSVPSRITFRRAFAAAALAAGLATVPSVGAAATGPLSEGVWRNPKNTVHLELRSCGAEVCGFVIWATPKAQNSPRDGSNLIGQQLLRGFRIGADGIGRGKVYVPDLNATFSGTATLIDARNLRARGCVVANVLCKSQVWTRIDNVPS